MSYAQVLQTFGSASGTGVVSFSIESTPAYKAHRAFYSTISATDISIDFIPRLHAQNQAYTAHVCFLPSTTAAPKDISAMMNTPSYSFSTYYPATGAQSTRVPFSLTAEMTLQLYPVINGLSPPVIYIILETHNVYIKGHFGLDTTQNYSLVTARLLFNLEGSGKALTVGVGSSLTP